MTRLMTAAFALLAFAPAAHAGLTDCARSMLCCEGDACGDELAACLQNSDGETVDQAQVPARMRRLARLAQALLDDAEASGEAVCEDDSAGQWDIVDSGAAF